MKRLRFAILAMAFAASTANGEERVRSIVFHDGASSIQISSDAARAQQMLVQLDSPELDHSVYALKGMIRYTGVSGDAFLQMDNTFEGRGTFFTKGIADSGPLAKLNGDSDWRPFTLPFYADQEGEALTPDGISLSVVLPDSGSVEIRDVALFQYAPGGDPMRGSDPWVVDRTAILIGAIGGALVGIWGGIVGMLASRGKARGFALGSATFVLVTGVISLCAGIVAFAIGQPYVVYYPLLLIGLIVTLVVGGLRRTLPKRYEAFEMQKMRAMDA